MQKAPPSLPQRRVPPPPPPRKKANNAAVHDAEAESQPLTIAARLASLRLDHLERGVANKPPPARSYKPEQTRRPPSVGNRVEDDEVDDNQEIPHSDSPHLIPNPRPPPPIPPRWTRPDYVAEDDHAVPDVVARTINAHSTKSPVPPPPPKRNVPSEPVAAPDRPRVEPPESDTQASLQDTGQCLKCRDFSHVDAHAALFPRQTVTSLQTLALSLTEPFSDDTDKARAIFTWLHHNIAYDTHSFFSGNLRAATPQSTLNSGVAVCEGYAGLFKHLATFAGVEAMTITGHGKGFGYAPLPPGSPLPAQDSNHAWNAVLMDGEWQLIDACWGAGVLEGSTFVKRFDATWFSSTPTEFVKRHFPTEPRHQLIADEDGGPISWEAYIRAPEGPTLFSDFHRLNLHPDYLQPSTKCVRGGTRVAFHVWKLCGHMSTADEDNYALFLQLSSEQRIPLELNGAGGWGVEVMVPAASGEVSILCVTVVDGQDALGLGAEGFTRAIGRKGMAFVYLARWTVE